MGISTNSRSKHKRKQKYESKISEEDIAEYLAIIAQKNPLKVAKKLESRNVYGYANDSNPFVWRKKIERDVTQLNLRRKDRKRE